MKRGERVAPSMKDRSGRNYTPTSDGGQSRMKAATLYMDKGQKTQIYTIDERGEFGETDRHHAAARIEDTQTKYQQHVVFTTLADPKSTLYDERETAEFIAQKLRERRPDAEIYAVAVHTDAHSKQEGVHVHVAFGTNTTLRREDLQFLRETAYDLEHKLDRENGREKPHERHEPQERHRERATPEERRERRQERQQAREHGQEIER